MDIIYQPKSSSSENLAESINAILQSRLMLDKEIAKVLPPFLSEKSKKSCLEKFDLTDREKRL
ncbi:MULTISPECIES: response regulator transcription factor [unclassified Caldicellulosiruptor]|uniref:response regulator transcription factor n=1 Tax=unclassified Caldicellulosiruptor TaxID=2622462 RepID=UPI0003A2E858|nr:MULTISPECIES: response regulator transcription factor [unclassified Caldicellulosiruptor]